VLTDQEAVLGSAHPDTQHTRKELDSLEDSPDA
jgi:hypothetical protein